MDYITPTIHPPEQQFLRPLTKLVNNSSSSLRKFPSPELKGCFTEENYMMMVSFTLETIAY